LLHVQLNSVIWLRFHFYMKILRVYHHSYHFDWHQHHVQLKILPLFHPHFHIQLIKAFLQIYFFDLHQHHVQLNILLNYYILFYKNLLNNHLDCLVQFYIFYLIFYFVYLQLILVFFLYIKKEIPLLFHYHRILSFEILNLINLIDYLQLNFL